MKVTIRVTDGAKRVINDVREVQFVNGETFGQPSKTGAWGRRLYINPMHKAIVAIEIEEEGE